MSWSVSVHGSADEVRRQVEEQLRGASGELLTANQHRHLDNVLGAVRCLAWQLPSDLGLNVSGNGHVDLDGVLTGTINFNTFAK